MRRAGRSSLFVLASLAALGACEGREIVVFAPVQAGSAGSSPSAGSGGLIAGGSGGSLDTAGTGGAAANAGAGGGEKPCQTFEDCGGPSWLCQKRACGDLEGVCSSRPLSDDPKLLPVCGCDRITYWNDTLRQQYGVPATITLGECRFDALPCMNSAECPEDGTCSQKLLDVRDCPNPGSGQCWRIPNNCASSEDKPDGLPCPAQVPPGQMPPCLTACQALQANRPYVRVPGGYKCPQF
jgi:hypothetical protein